MGYYMPAKLSQSDKPKGKVILSFENIKYTEMKLWAVFQTAELLILKNSGLSQDHW